MIPKLENQRIAITGAAQGLGAALLRAFDAAGAEVIAIDRDAAALHAQPAVRAGRAQALITDLARLDQTRAAAAKIAAGPGVDMLIHNAAILRPIPFADLGFDEFRRTLDIGLTAGFVLAQAVWPEMQARGGALVFVSSNSGINGFADEAHYCATKHALEGFSKSLALEVIHPELISCTITPGFAMHTPMSEANYQPEQKKTWVEPDRLCPAFLRIAQDRPAAWNGKRLNAWEISNMETSL